MQPKKTKTYLLGITLFVIFTNVSSSYSQKTADSSLYNWFDSLLGKENSALNNGALHVNPYKTSDKNNSCYLFNEFSIGSISYENQQYYDVNLKYDIYKDVLILKPFGESNSTAVNLDSDRTDSFFIKGKKFVNLSNRKSLAKPEFINGYYEENLNGKSLTFYIKYRKTVKEIIENTTVNYKFEERNEYILNYKNTYYQVSSKRDFTNIFPEHKDKIKEFYLMNSRIENSNKKQFMESLILYINNFLLNESN